MANRDELARRRRKRAKASPRIVWVLEQLVGHRWTFQLTFSSRGDAVACLRQGTPFAQSIRRVVPYGPMRSRRGPVDR